MPELHEVLAVEGDLEDKYKTEMNNAKRLFMDRLDLFSGWHRVCEMFEKDVKGDPEDHKELSTTVFNVINNMSGHVAKYFDAVLQKDATNQNAVSDLVVDNITIGKDLPATFLLGLENKLKRLRVVYEKIPTLDPGIKWELDKDKGEGIRARMHPKEEFKTKKVPKEHVLYEAVIKDGVGIPAQVEKYSETINVGLFTRFEWTGMMTQAELTVRINKIDKLYQAVKKARNKANKAQIVKTTIGKEIMNYINS